MRLLLVIALFSALVAADVVFRPRFTASPDWNESTRDFFSTGPAENSSRAVFGLLPMYRLPKRLFEFMLALLQPRLAAPWYTRDNVCVSRTENVSALNGSAFARRICVDSEEDGRRVCKTSVANATHSRHRLEEYSCCAGFVLDQSAGCVPAPDLSAVFANHSTFAAVLADLCAGDAPCSVFLPEAELTDEQIRAHVVPGLALTLRDLRDAPSFATSAGSLIYISTIDGHHDDYTYANCEEVLGSRSNGTLSVFSIKHPLASVEKSTDDFLEDRDDLSEIYDALERTFLFDDEVFEGNTLLLPTNKALEGFKYWPRIKAHPDQLRAFLLDNIIPGRTCASGGGASRLATLSGETVFVVSDHNSTSVHVADTVVPVAEVNVVTKDGTIHVLDGFVSAASRTVDMMLEQMNRSDVGQLIHPNLNYSHWSAIVPVGYPLPDSPDARSMYLQSGTVDRIIGTIDGFATINCVPLQRPGITCALDGKIYSIAAPLPTVHHDLVGALKSVNASKYNVSRTLHMLQNLSEAEAKVINDLREVTFLVPLDEVLSFTHPTFDTRCFLKNLVIQYEVCSGSSHASKVLFSNRRYLNFETGTDNRGDWESRVGGAKIVVPDLIMKHGIVHLIDNWPQAYYAVL